jgi:hypothetical protein
MEGWMKRTILLRSGLLRSGLICALLLAAGCGLGAQEASSYEGTSNPPPDNTIVTSDAEQTQPAAAQPAKPSAAHIQTAAPAQPTSPAEVPAAEAAYNDGSDGGIVTVEESSPTQPQPAQRQPILSERTTASDPDGDIVHPQPLRPGEVAEGATIRVRLLDRLSTAMSEKGEAFRSRVASDVLQDGQVLIPAGAEIDGHLTEVSSGHTGGHGTMRLRPETVILPNGLHYQLYAQLSGMPGSKSKVGGEGTVRPGSQLKRDSIEYGAVAGGGATTGAVLAGPAGAMAGGIIGASVVTLHLLANHPQATLEPGTVLVFTLSESLQLSPTVGNGN